ncbi:MAG: NAD(P)-dependent dehydrogenase (short-subunit alcohol dehydrogenase family) [Chlamydiales bacterium]|jgi:NAD(P)-dependent dehydrogenase (short-subunit alcohol dehydrogenase family)
MEPADPVGICATAVDNASIHESEPNPFRTMSSATVSEPTPKNMPTPPRLRGVPSDRRRALVIGASSGMGAALVRQLAAEGYRVAALARRGELLGELAEACRPACEQSGGAVSVYTHDVTDVASIPALFEQVVRDLGGLDLAIYAAGIMPTIKADEYDTEKDLAQVEVNLSGCIAWGNEIARLLRTQRSGTLVGISSIAGDRGRKGNPVYNTTKAAMNCYLEALRNRLSEVGVRVVTIKPGFVDTPMTEGLGLRGAISADKAASQILGAARGSFWNTRYIPIKWLLVGTIIRLIPSFIFKKLSI